MIPAAFPREIIRLGSLRLIRSGPGTEKNPEGTIKDIGMVWRAVPDAGDGLPGVVAQGTIGGTVFQLHISGGNIDQMLREIEKVVDQERGKAGAKWGTA